MRQLEKENKLRITAVTVAQPPHKAHKFYSPLLFSALRYDRLSKFGWLLRFPEKDIDKMLKTSFILLIAVRFLS